MADLPLPAHVVTRRRDGRREVLLHRSLAVIDESRVEIRAARSTVFLPLVGLAFAAAAGYLMATKGGAIPLWGLVAMLLAMLLLVPLSAMGLVSSLVGADVVVDAAKNSATWQQGYLGMGVGTRELVPFEKIDHLEITVEGDEPDRWQQLSDDLRQFRLTLVKKSGKQLTLAQVPVPANAQEDGMDRTMAVAQAVAAVTGARLQLPPGWELIEIDTDTGAPVPPGTGAPLPPPERQS